MSNVKAGDLAYIVNSRHRENNLRFVQVLRPASDGEMFVSADGVHTLRTNTNGLVGWVVEASTPLIWSSTVTRIPLEFARRPICDAALRPIRPQDDDAQDESKAWLPPVPTKEIA